MLRVVLPHGRDRGGQPLAEVVRLGRIRGEQPLGQPEHALDARLTLAPVADLEELVHVSPIMLTRRRPGFPRKPSPRLGSQAPTPTAFASVSGR
jgi:hypothetical protein